MVLRKHNQTAGFSLIEVLVAITILGLVVVPIGSSLVLSFRLNARSEQMLQAQLAVSSAVETIMAEGFDPSIEEDYEEQFGVDIEITDDSGAAYGIKVTALDENSVKIISISVDTFVRPAPIDPEEGGDES